MHLKQTKCSKIIKGLMQG